MNRTSTVVIFLATSLLIGASASFAAPLQCTGSAVPSASCATGETMNPSCSCNATCKAAGNWNCTDKMGVVKSSGDCVSDANDPCKVKKKGAVATTLENSFSTQFDPIVSSSVGQ